MDYEQVWNMSEEELQKKYMEIISGLEPTDPRECPDITTKVVYDYAEHRKVSEKHRLLLTVIFQHQVIKELRGMMEDMAMRNPDPIPLDDVP